MDNRFTENSTLHIPNDYYTYGGINRTVELHRVGRVYLERMAFHCIKQAGTGYKAFVRVCFHAIEAVQNASLQLELAGVTVRQALPPLTAGQASEASFAFEVPTVKEWDLLQPQLYALKATLFADNCPEDDLIDRVGFRTVTIDGTQLLLNGKPVYLKGFNRHEDHGLFGCALPQEAMMDDLQRILDTGANTIRTCHYPNDPLFLESRISSMDCSNKLPSAISR